MCKHSSVTDEETCHFCRVQNGKAKPSNGNGNGNGHRNGYRVFHPSNNPEFYKTLGYFVTHAELIAMVLIKNEEDFKRRYIELKGHDPNYNCYILTNPQWANQFRIIVNLPTWNLDCGNIPQVKGSKDTEAYFNSNSFVWWLLEKGFDLGKKHDYDAIRLHIPEEYQEIFDEGAING